jgi:hypothetical protein
MGTWLRRWHRFEGHERCSVLHGPDPEELMLIAIPILLIIGAVTNVTTFIVMLCISAAMVLWAVGLAAAIEKERKLGHIEFDPKRLTNSLRGT